MAIGIEQLVEQLRPETTILFFGSGSSIPSGAPSVADLEEHFATVFKLKREGFTLSELTDLAEGASTRQAMIAELRSKIAKVSPTGGLRNIALYPWKSIFTTNYDELVETCYRRHGSSLTVYSSDFDFTLQRDSAPRKLFKLHGTISKDIGDGDKARIIITDTDYDHTRDYRAKLYDRLRGDLSEAENLIIIGHSLGDRHIKEEVERAISLSSASGAKITLFLYQRDDDRAKLHEKRGIKICFGGIDDFFACLTKVRTATIASSIQPDNILDRIPALRPSTIEVQHAIGIRGENVDSMFHGWPATYGEIAGGYTFERTLTEEVSDFFDNTAGSLTAIIVGASGVGKTTAARQIAIRRQRAGVYCWEHKGDQQLSVEHWTRMMGLLKKDGAEGLLIVDDAHAHLQEINDIIDRATAEDNGHLRLVLTSSRNHWYPRIKTPNLYKYGKEWVVSKLNNAEIELLLQLTDTKEPIRKLVEGAFSGFSKEQRRRRLIERCEKDFFVCLRNIFASESLDDIILREFAGLQKQDQEIYRYVAAMENAGIRVHRQLLIRLLSLPTASVSAILQNLLDVVQEDSGDDHEPGIYIWRTRHSVIASIIAKFKFSDENRTVDLFDKVIDFINPTYAIEVRTIRDLCNIETGLPRISDKNVQNRLLRKMMSVAPGERVPRHRLIRNLIDQAEFEKAETEIRIFNKDFGSDGPVHRYKVNLMVGRATRTPGLLDEDRVAILEQAKEIAVAGIDRYPNNKNMLSAYCELGIEYYRRTGKFTFYDDAMSELSRAEDRSGDPDLSRLVTKFERRMGGQPAVEVFESE